MCPKTHFIYFHIIKYVRRTQRDEKRLLPLLPDKTGKLYVNLNLTCKKVGLERGIRSVL